MDRQTGVLDGATFWERVAATRWGRYITAIEREVIIDAAEKFGIPGRAIEIGCEGGRWSKMLADNGWSLTCIDVDAETLAVCRERIPGSTCIVTKPDDMSIPCSSCSAELMLLIEVLPVLRSGWFAGEASRVLVPDGRLVALVWNRSSWRGLAAHATARLRSEDDWYTVRYGAWKQELESTGFTIEREDGFCWFPLRRASDSRLAPVFAACEQYSGLRHLPRFSPWIMTVARKQVSGVSDD